MPTFDEMFDEVATEEQPQDFDALFAEIQAEEQEAALPLAISAPAEVLNATMRGIEFGAEGSDYSRRKRALEEQTAVAREEGRLGRFGEKLIRAVEGATGVVSHMDPLEIAGNIINPQHRTILPPGGTQKALEYAQERIIGMPPAEPGSVRQGVNQFVDETLTGLSAPEMVLAMGAGKIPASRVVAPTLKQIPPRLFQVDMAGASGEAIKQIEEAETPGEVAKGTLGAAMAIGVPFGIERHVSPRIQPPVPDVQGIRYGTPRGAARPRAEAAPRVERATPAQRAAQMREQHGGQVPTEDPRFRVPTGPEAPLPERPAPAPAPVPETSVEIATWQDAVTELRKRGKGTETREEVKKLMPELQRLSNEAARDLALEAWGADWKPGGKEKPPIGERKPSEKAKEAPEVQGQPVLERIDDTQGQGRLPSGEPPNAEELRNVQEQGQGPSTPTPDQAVPVKRTLAPEEQEKVKAHVQGAASLGRSVVEIEGPDGQKYRATYDGDWGPGIQSLTLLEDFPGSGKGPKDTTTNVTLQKAGYKVPSDMPPVTGKPIPVHPDYAPKVETKAAVPETKPAPIETPVPEPAPVTAKAEPAPVAAPAPEAPAPAPAPAAPAQPRPATFYGEPVKGKRTYNLTDPIVDPKTGEVLHPAGSNVSEATLQKYGVPFEAPKVEAKPVEKAAAEIKAEVSQVAAEQGKPAARAVKSELVSRIEGEIAKLTPLPGEAVFGEPKTYSGTKRITVRLKDGEAEGELLLENRGGAADGWQVIRKGWGPGKDPNIPRETRQILAYDLSLQEAKAFADEQIRTGNPWHADKPIGAGLETIPHDRISGTVRDQPETITIEIPGDGTFTIPRTHYALNRILARAQKLETSAAPKKPFTEHLPSKKEGREALQEAEALAKAEPPKPEPAKPEPIGMGGAVPSEFQAGGSPTAMKYKLIDEDRQKRNLPALAKPEGLSDQAAMDRAIGALDKDPSAAERLEKDILDGKRGVIEDWENHLLLLRKIDLRNEYYKAATEAAKAYEDAQQFPNRMADMRDAQARAQHWEALLNNVEEASRKSGSARGRALRSLQVMANEDYSLEALTLRKRVSKGGSDLTPDERAKLVKEAADHAAKSAELEKKVEELTKERDAKEAEAIKARAEADAAKAAAAGAPKASPYIIMLAERAVAGLDKRADAARQRIKDRQIRFNTGIDPTVFLDLAEIGAAKIGHIGLDVAKWSAEMIAEFGPGLKPHLDRVWKDAQQVAERSVHLVSPKKAAAQVQKIVMKPTGAHGAPGAAADPATYAGKIKGRLAKDPKADIGFFARKIARWFVEDGIRDRDVLIDKVHEILRDVIPDLDRRGTMDAISGYGSYTQLPKDAVSKILRDLQGQMQQIAKLEDMAAGEAPWRTGKEQRTPSDIERGLQQEVHEAKRRGGYTVTDPELQLRTALDAVARRLENQIKDLEAQIAAGERKAKRTPLVDDARTAALRTRLNEVREEYAEVFAKPELTDAERLAKWKERTLERTEELKEIWAGRKQRKTRRPPVEMDKEALRLRFNLHEVERQIREREYKEKLAARPKWQKVIGGGAELLNVSRSLLTSYDLSAPLRQGLFIGGAHPIRAARNVPEMFRALVSEKDAFRIAEEIRNRDNAPLYETSGLYLAEHGGRLSKMEEVNMSRWAEAIPGVRASQRAYTAFLNKLRADSFDAMTKGLTADGKGNPAELKAIANFINVATGRGNIGWNQAATGLNTIFFAPRYVASRFQLLAMPFTGFGTLNPKTMGTLRTRTMIAKEYGRFLASAAVVYALAQSAGGEVETDWKSSDFGKIRIGNTRIDPMAGLLQSTVLLGRSITGESKTLKGQTYPITGDVPYGKPDFVKVWANFLRGKLSPALGTAVSLRVGKDPSGKDFGVSDLPAQTMMPISWQDIYQATKEHGVPTGAALGVLAIFGMGVMTHEPEENRQRL